MGDARNLAIAVGVAIAIPGALVAWAAIDPPPPSEWAAVCINRASGEAYDARGFQLGYEYTDRNGLRRRIDARNSDQWRCERLSP